MFAEYNHNFRFSSQNKLGFQNVLRNVYTTISFLGGNI